jgi:hypothetical protein
LIGFEKGMIYMKILKKRGGGGVVEKRGGEEAKSMPNAPVEKDSELIQGEGVVVEIDESKFGKRKYHKGRQVEGQWVFGGIDRESNKCFFVTVEDRSQRTLLQSIKDIQIVILQCLFSIENQV